MADIVYTPPISPNVDLIFTGTGTYTPQISPNVDMIFGTQDTETSGEGAYNKASEFFLMF